MAVDDVCVKKPTLSCTLSKANAFFLSEFTSKYTVYCVPFVKDMLFNLVWICHQVVCIGAGFKTYPSSDAPLPAV